MNIACIEICSRAPSPSPGISVPWQLFLACFPRALQNHPLGALQLVALLWVLLAQMSGTSPWSTGIIPVEIPSVLLTRSGPF